MLKLVRGFRPAVPIFNRNHYSIGLRYTSSQRGGQNSSEKRIPNGSIKPLRENILTLPNVLTITRLAAAPAIGYLVIQNSYPLALGLMVYASITDFVDGYLARKYQNFTVFGSIADPAADKALMVTLAGCLSYSGIVPLWCGAAILGRDAALAISAFVVRFRTLPHPKTLGRYFDVTLPSVKVTPTKISKWNTFFQMIYLCVCLGDQVFPIVGSDILQGMAIVVTGTTVWSGFSYLFNSTAVQPVVPNHSNFRRKK